MFERGEDRTPLTVDKVREHHPNSNLSKNGHVFQRRDLISHHYLEAASDSATDFLGRAFRDIRWCNSRYRPNPDTRYHSPRVDFA